MTCFECGLPAQAQHHVVPQALGGTKTVPLCLVCHGKVHSKDLLLMRKLQEAAREQRRRAGQIVHVHAAYGWRKTRGKQQEPDPEEQEVIQQILLMRRTGMLLADISADLNCRSLTRRNGKPWIAATVAKIVDRYWPGAWPKERAGRPKRIAGDRAAFREERRARDRARVNAWKAEHREQVRAEGREYMRRKREARRAAREVLH